MTEIELHQNPGADLAVQMDYAKAVSSAALLPQAYRGKPADIMLAVGLGSAMGLSPAESLYRIDVIQGKPTASAELIAANVRKAGHKLRLRVDEQAVSATCTIIRADDPDYEHTVTRDRAWAEQMGLLGKDNYKKQPATMLGWRAVSACARMACPEALYGVAYSSDEMTDFEPSRPAQSGLGAALAQQPTTTAEQVTPEGEKQDAAADQPLTERTRGAMFALFGETGITTRDDQLAFIADTLGRGFESRADLSESDGLKVEARLRRIKDGDADAEWMPDLSGGAA